MPSLIKPELLSLSPEQIHVLMPFLTVVAGMVLTILASPFQKVQPKWLTFFLTLITCAGAGFQSFALLREEPIRVFNQMMRVDGYTQFFNLMILGAALITALGSFRYLDREKLPHAEYFVLILASAFGMMMMVSATDLIVMFIALELMSLSVYSLVGFRRADRKSNEAALKYFILGGAASAILLYGVALVYGVTRTTQIHQVLAYVTAQAPLGALPMLYAIGIWLILVGFLFKVASVPFHMWMPDVYEGAPVPITGFMTTGLKAASFAAFVRVFASVGYGTGLTEAIQAHVHDILWIVAVLTMLIGNVIALTQTNLKRMLGYSSIAHTGYILIGFVTGGMTEQGYAPVVVYLLAYCAMNLGAFIVLAILSNQNDEGLNLHDMAGISKQHPWLAFAMAVFLFSMAGVPPTAGFVAKYLLFYSAVQSGEIVLVILAVLCSAISAYYYLRVLVYMYMRDPTGAESGLRVPIWSAAAVAAMVVLTLQWGLIPSPIVLAAKRAVTGM